MRAHGASQGLKKTAMCDSPRLVNARELAVILGLPIGTVYDRSRRDAWPRFRIGHAVRWNADEVLALLRRDGGDGAG